MTFDEFVRYVLLPALGAGALVCLVLTLREEWRAWKDGEW